MMPDSTPADDAPDRERDGAPARKRHGFSAFLVERPVTVFMLFLTLAGTGLISYLRIPLTLLPRGLSSSSLSISMPYQGASPSEVEDQLTRPVEEALRTIPGIIDVTSVSSEGVSDISVEFGSRVDMDIAYGEARDRIERVRPQLPKEMDRYRIRRFNTNTDMPVMSIGVQYDDKARDPFGPIEKIAVPRLEGVEGVASVALHGLVDEAVRIFVDVDKVRGYGINLGAVIAQLQQDNFTLPAGQIDDGNRRFALRIDSRFHDMDDIRRYPIGNGRVLGDVAEVVRARAYRDTVWRINGQPAVGMRISRESDQNTIEVCERIEAVLAELKADERLSGVTFNVFFNQKDSIKDAIGGLKSSGLWGGLFAVIVLWWFLRDLRLTLVAALAIPASLLAALMAVYFGGQTLNLISLTGFTLGIGMLVDNAVVVIENIATRRAEGLSRQEASATGAGQVGLAVLASTLTSVVVFLPLVFMDGARNTRIFLREVGLPISWSLFASLIVAIGFLPSFTARVMKRDGSRRSGSGVGGPDGRMGHIYRSAMHWVLTHRLAAFALLMVIVALTNIAGDNVPASKGGDNMDGGVTMDVEVPPTYLLADANKVFEHFEAWADANREAFGVEFFSTRFDRRGGQIEFYPREDLPRAESEALGERLRDMVPALPGVRTTIGFEGGSQDKTLRINLEGPDFGVLAGISRDLKERLAALLVEQPDGSARPMLDNVRTDIEKGVDEVHVSVDRDRASELGVSPEVIRGTVAWGLGGQRLPDFADGDRDIRVQIEYGQSDEESLSFLRNLGLSRPGGAQVPLESVASIDFSKAAGSLVRRNGRTSTGISAQPAVENLYLVSSRIDEVLANYPFPEGVTWNEEGGRREFEQDMAELFSTLILSIVLVYLVMAILLESVMLPMSIMLSIPLAVMGVDITLWATNYPRDVMVYIGLILLAGVVVNNAIVLLDHVQRLRAAGLSRHDALVRGGADRLRPILMTALTTIFGLMPMALPDWFPGENGGSGYESMAVTVAGGLAFSTLLTLLVVPLFYTCFDDLGLLFARLWPWRPGHAGGRPPEPADTVGSHAPAIRTPALRTPRAGR